VQQVLCKGGQHLHPRGLLEVRPAQRHHHGRQRRHRHQGHTQGSRDRHHLVLHSNLKIFVKMNNPNLLYLKLLYICTYRRRQYTDKKEN